LNYCFYFSTAQNLFYKNNILIKDKTYETDFYYTHQWTTFHTVFTLYLQNSGVLKKGTNKNIVNRSFPKSGRTLKFIHKYQTYGRHFDFL
jgi:hypothetical protein